MRGIVNIVQYCRSMFVLVLILLLAVGSGLVYLSRFNFTPVTVNLGYYVFADIPLFYVITGSLLLGLVLSYVFYLINAISAHLKLKGKESEIKKNKDEVLELTKRVHQLELENEKLKNGSSTAEVDPKAL